MVTGYSNRLREEQDLVLGHETEKEYPGLLELCKELPELTNDPDR